MLDIAANKWDPIDYIISGNVIELRFHQSNQPVFSCVFAARKYGQGGNVNSLLAIDKAPGRGHIRFPDGLVSDTLLDTDNDGFTDIEEVSLFNTNPGVAERWDDWETISSILPMPKIISLYLQRQFNVETQPGQPFTKPVYQLFRENTGDGDDYAVLATNWLAKNGYTAYFVKVLFDKEWQGYQYHGLCMYQDKDGYWYAIDVYFHDSGRNPVGPFYSMTEYCQQVPSRYGNSSLSGIELYDCEGKVVW